MHPRYLDPDVTWVAIDGGPGGGKSTGMAFIRQRLEDLGYRVVVVEEQATKLVGRGLSPFTTWGDPTDFQRHILRSITNAEQEAYDAAQDLRPRKPTVFLCDRGAPSGMAYMQRDLFEAVVKDEGYSLLELYDRYKIAIFLVTAANGAEEYYTTANNTARSETPKQAREVDRRTRLAWQGHQHLRVVDNSTGFDEKMRRAFNQLARVLNMPTLPDGHEIERKFVILDYRPELIGPEAGLVRITQDYLVSNEEGTGRRVRKREADGAVTYFYTEKRETGTPGDRLEREHQISFKEYQSLLQERQPGVETIIKYRSTVAYAGHYLEYDNFLNPRYLDWLHVLEVEVPDLAERINLPPGLELVEVTSDPRFSNYAIAAGKLRGVTLDDVLRMPRLQTAA